MDPLTETKSMLDVAIERMHLVQHHAPARAQPLIHAILQSLEGSRIMMDDLRKTLDGETAKGDA